MCVFSKHISYACLRTSIVYKYFRSVQVQRISIDSIPIGQREKEPGGEKTEESETEREQNKRKER